MMKQILNDQERNRLDQRIAEAEKITGAQIVLAVVKRCDSYPEIPWKAFAVGASIGALVVFLLELFFFSWMPQTTLLVGVVSVTLFAGIAFVLLTVSMAGLARIFLAENRAEEEVRQYAESVFLDRELFATSQRTAILMLVSMFERKVMILPDTGLRDFLDKETIRTIISSMAPILAAGDLARALEDGLKGLEKVLSGKIEKEASSNELANDIIEEKGV
ncbi:TPM domain-containing protein [Thermodesulfobacteriota bacterium]